MATSIPAVSILVIAAIVLSFLADLILSAIWLPLYFTRGIRIYSRSFPANPATEWPLPPYELEDAFRSDLTYSLAFHSVSHTEYAFREKLIQFKPFRYAAIMHGLLIWDFSARSVRIRGYSAWSLIVIFAIILASALASLLQGSTHLLIVLAALAVMSSIDYVLQAYAYGQIGKYAARRWSEGKVAYGADA